MDAFTNDATLIDVPTSGTHFRQHVSRLEVQSNVGGIVTGSNIGTGNIEFWPSNYGTQNDSGVPNASASQYDFGDGGSGTGNGYGSMQVHNYGAQQTLWAVNRFNINSGSLSTGIGNNTGAGRPDYTFADNAGSWDSRTLHVFVLPGGDGDTTAPSISQVTASASLDQVVVQFSEEMADVCADPTRFSINNGVTISAATLQPSKKAVSLTTSTLTAGQTYSLTVAGELPDRSLNANLVAPYPAKAFTAPQPPTLPAFFGAVPEFGDYDLIHQLAVSVPTNYANGCNYSIDESYTARPPFDRIAYCMELTTGGVTTWVWVSMGVNGRSEQNRCSYG